MVCLGNVTVKDWGAGRVVGAGSTVSGPCKPPLSAACRYGVCFLAGSGLPKFGHLWYKYCLNSNGNAPAYRLSASLTRNASSEIKITEIHTGDFTLNHLSHDESRS